jgi:hypothetical protein
MLLVAGILLIWVLAACAAAALCAAARRGDQELSSVRPVVLHTVGGHASRRTRAS